MKLSGRAQEDLTPSSLEGGAYEVGGPGPPGRGPDESYLSADYVRLPDMSYKSPQRKIFTDVII